MIAPIRKRTPLVKSAKQRLAGSILATGSNGQQLRDHLRRLVSNRQTCFRAGSGAEDEKGSALKHNGRPLAQVRVCGID
jgi:hypothetical protein